MFNFLSIVCEELKQKYVHDFFLQKSKKPYQCLDALLIEDRKESWSLHVNVHIFRHNGKKLQVSMEYL